MGQISAHLALPNQNIFALFLLHLFLDIEAWLNIFTDASQIRIHYLESLLT